VNCEQLAHVLRAAARITDGAEIIVIGSQAILGSYDADHLPARVTLSIEADLAFRYDPDETKSDKVDGAIGELSAFHDTFGYYGQGVSVATALLPDGWRERLVRFDREDAAPAVAWCLESHDLVVSKLVAGRQKDVEFAEALLGVGLVDAVLLEQRAQMRSSRRHATRRNVRLRGICRGSK
jgi:hypothetical protein